MATNISEMFAVRRFNVERKQEIERAKNEPVNFMVVKRQAGTAIRRQLYLATTEKISVFQEAALLHAFPAAVSSDRVAIDPVSGKTKAELDAKAVERGLSKGRNFYWLANVDGLTPEDVDKLAKGAKSIALNAVLYLHEATAQMLEEMTSAPDDGDVPTRKVVIRDSEAEVEVEAEELFVG